MAQTFIMEQYLDGPEVDVDLVVSQVLTPFSGSRFQTSTLEDQALKGAQNLSGKSV